MFALKTQPFLARASALVLAAALLPPLAQAQTVVPAGSSIGFTTQQMGVPVSGKFGQWTAQVRFDPAQPQAGAVAFSIDTASASMGVAETDAELVKAEWFGAAKFPKATFQSTAIKALAAQRFEVTGNLTIKGKTRPVVVPVQWAQRGAQATATGEFTIKRLDFDIGAGEWADPGLVANDVKVRFTLQLQGLNAR